MKTDDISAFPMTGEGLSNPRYSQYGMTLRDYFAGQALTGLLANPVSFTIGNPKQLASTDDFAELAFIQADAMLAERAKRGK